jgi:hypothetical protein
MSSNLNMTNTLIMAGANLNTQDKYGLTPLHYGNIHEKLRFLIEHK